MKKLFSLAVLAIFMAMPLASMAEGLQRMVLTLTDNTTQSFMLNDQPVVAFGETDLTVKSGETTYTVERALVKTFTFEEGTLEGIHQVGDIIGSANTVNRLYDLNGRLLQENNINTSSLPAGTYILQMAGQKTVKIQKR